MNGKIELAKTCSTCKHSIWSRSSKNGKIVIKKQTGICIVFCNGIPKKTENNIFILKNSGMFCDLKGELKKHPDDMISKEEYLKKCKEECKRNNRTKEFTKNILEKSEKYYNSIKENYNWWKDNIELCRMCHRQTYCSMYEKSDINIEVMAEKIVFNKI